MTPDNSPPRFGRTSREVTVPVWAVAAAGVFMAIAGFVAGRGLDTGPATGPAQSGPARSGIVASVDIDSGTVCVETTRDARTVECYPAPGAGLADGDEISYRLEERPVDPDDRSKGVREEIVWVAPPALGP